MDYRMLHNMGSESASSGRVRPILTELWSFQIIWLGSADRTGRTMNRQKGLGNSFGWVDSKSSRGGIDRLG